MLSLDFLKTQEVRRDENRTHFVKAIRLALVFASFGGITNAQDLSAQGCRHFLHAGHAALYPEVMCVGCIVPIWDHGYLLHVEIDGDPAVVTMYDKNGKKVLEARMEDRLMLPKFLSVLQEQRGPEGLLRLAEAS